MPAPIHCEETHLHLREMILLVLAHYRLVRIMSLVYATVAEGQQYAEWNELGFGGLEGAANKY
jgi:hypothetical protein